MPNTDAVPKVQNPGNADEVLRRVYNRDAAALNVSPGSGSVAVTKSDVTVYDPPLRSLYVTGAGDVKFRGIDGEDDTWTVPDNSMIPVAVDMVYSTGTTATGIHGVR